MNRSETIKRELLWTKGIPVHASDKIQCGCCLRKADREFEFGFFCEKCFMKAAECKNQECNLTPRKTKPTFLLGRGASDSEQRCRNHQKSHSFSASSRAS